MPEKDTDHVLDSLGITQFQVGDDPDDQAFGTLIVADSPASGATGVTVPPAAVAAVPSELQAMMEFSQWHNSFKATFDEPLRQATEAQSAAEKLESFEKSLTVAQGALSPLWSLMCHTNTLTASICRAQTYHMVRSAERAGLSDHFKEEAHYLNLSHENVADLFNKHRSAVQQDLETIDQKASEKGSPESKVMAFEGAKDLLETIRTASKIELQLHSLGDPVST